MKVWIVQGYVATYFRFVLKCNTMAYFGKMTQQWDDKGHYCSDWYEVSLIIYSMLIALTFILRSAHNSKCHHVIQEVLDWPDSDFELSFWWCSFTNALLVQTWRKWNKQSQSQRKRSTSTTQGWSRFWSLQVHCCQWTYAIWWETDKDKSDN